MPGRHRPPRARAGQLTSIRETHISWVLLAGDRAYKLKKPVRLPFVDYGSLERRHALCREEVRLNRRLAPDVYLGVRALVAADGGVRLAEEDAPGAVEYVVEMRRYDEAATLARRLGSGTAGESEVRAVGRRLARFHREATRPADPAATVDVLRAEHVVLERGIEIVDCVEFDPALREIDVGFDLAFLAMDLMRVDERLAAALVSAYREAGGDPGDDALVAIRAKVALVRAGQVDAADARRRRADATALLDLAARLTWRVRLGAGAIVCGLAASGKSTLAAALAERTGARVLSSDVVRKELLGIAPTERAPRTAYEPEVSRRTYEELGRRARESIALGQPVIVDATFRFAADRDAFGATELPWIECRAPAAVRIRRAAGARPVTDAGADVAALQSAQWDPLVPAVAVRTDRDAGAAMADVRVGLDARLPASPARL